MTGEAGIVRFRRTRVAPRARSSSLAKVFAAGKGILRRGERVFY